MAATLAVAQPLTSKTLGAGTCARGRADKLDAGIRPHGPRPLRPYRCGARACLRRWSTSVADRYAASACGPLSRATGQLLVSFAFTPLIVLFYISLGSICAAVVLAFFLPGGV